MKPKRCRVARCYGNKVELVELGGAIQTFKMSNTHQQLLQECLTVSGHVETCCLIRRKNSKIKATSFGYEPSADLVQSLIAAFNDTARTREKGIHFNGAMYNCVRADDNSIYGKKMSNSGFVAIKTDHFIIYGSYSSTMFPSVCVEAMESLGDYYRNKGK